MLGKIFASCFLTILLGYGYYSLQFQEVKMKSELDLYIDKYIGYSSKTAELNYWTYNTTRYHEKIYYYPILYFTYTNNSETFNCQPIKLNWLIYPDLNLLKYDTNIGRWKIGYYDAFTKMLSHENRSSDCKVMMNYYGHIIHHKKRYVEPYTFKDIQPIKTDKLRLRQVYWRTDKHKFIPVLNFDIPIQINGSDKSIVSERIFDNVNLIGYNFELPNFARNLRNNLMNSNNVTNPIECIPIYKDNMKNDTLDDLSQQLSKFGYYPDTYFTGSFRRLDNIDNLAVCEINDNNNDYHFGEFH